jgi:hypothetical protein
VIVGKPLLKDVVHITFFSQERDASGHPVHSFARVILRGNTVLSVR